MATKILLLGFLALTCSLASASDSSPLQDFCVADPNGPGTKISDDYCYLWYPWIRLLITLFLWCVAVKVNGFACKNAMAVQASDFSFGGLHITGNTSNPAGSKVTPVTVAQLAGLNTLGISLARIDYAPKGINPPHTHPRASEILTVVDGSLEVGFVTSNPDNRLIATVLQKGDVFVFPVGLIHFQRNVGKGSAIAIAALSSQNPGVITIANAVFGSKPDISTDILGKAFQVDNSVIAKLQAKF